MKKVLTLLFLTFVFGMTQAAFAQGEEAQLALKPGQQKIALRVFKVKFISVTEDSRCPVGTNCVWAGNAKVKLQITFETGAPKIYEINTTTGQLGAQIDSYAISISSLTPKPRSGKKPRASDYRATVEIRRITR